MLWFGFVYHGGSHTRVTEMYNEIASTCLVSQQSIEMLLLCPFLYILLLFPCPVCPQRSQSYSKASIRVQVSIAQYFLVQDSWFRLSSSGTVVP